jgi:hypothetical protein
MQNENIADQMAKLARLRSDNAISEDQYGRLKAKLLEKIVGSGSAHTPAQVQSEQSGCSFTAFTMIFILAFAGTFGLMFFLMANPGNIPAEAQGIPLIGLSVAVVLGAILIFYLYFLPTFIAFGRRHPNRIPILILNVLFGATIIGWILLLIWALRVVHISDQGRGGESGLNVYANDQKRLITDEPSSRVDRLAQLSELQKQGAITSAEYEALKSGVMSN